MPEITFNEVETEPCLTFDKGSPTIDLSTGGAPSGGGGGRVTLYSDARDRHDSCGVDPEEVVAGGGKPPLVAKRSSLLTLTQSPMEFRESTFSINYNDTDGNLFSAIINQLEIKN